MIYLISILTVILLISWKKSKSTFFQQDRDVLAEKRKLLIQVLRDRDVKEFHFIWAYDILRKYPNLYKFDGATIVADIDTIKGLDASAMVHDVAYQLAQHKGIYEYFCKKISADIEYGKNMRALGVSWLTAWTRVTALIISTPIWMAIIGLKGKFKVS
jgi:hypothetical protein